MREDVGGGERRGARRVAVDVRDGEEHELVVLGVRDDEDARAEPGEAAGEAGQGLA